MNAIVAFMKASRKNTTTAKCCEAASGRNRCGPSNRDNCRQQRWPTTRNLKRGLLCLPETWSYVFGGPIAHLGYFRDELVVRRKWIDEAGYADFVALCQFLPGPASSQVGFALGLLRAGPLGALAAWTAFTLPSALLLVAFAMTATASDSPVGAGLLDGLKIVAIVVVAQAVWGMARSLTPDRPRAAIALSAMLTVIFVSSAIRQVAAIALGGALGLMLYRSGEATGITAITFRVPRWIGITSLIAFFALLVLLPLAASSGLSGISLFDAFYRSGALVLAVATWCCLCCRRKSSIQAG